MSSPFVFLRGKRVQEIVAGDVGFASHRRSSESSRSVLLASVMALRLQSQGAMG